MMFAISNLFSHNDTLAEAALAHLTAEDVPALAEALATSVDKDHRWWAACALSRIADPEASAALLRATAEADADVRAAVFQALGERGEAQAVVPLLFALADPSDYLARLAADTLIRLGEPAVPSLIRALENDADTRVRGHAARALALIGDQRAIPALFKALADESAIVQHWADEGLERLGVGQVYFMP
jgi:HEAT repeat protein